jgi:nucleoside-diphosphate-sugar epimerase
MSSLVRRFRAGESIRLKTPDSIKDYIHVDDVARALLQLIRSDFDGSINIGTGVGTRIADIAHRIALLLGRPGLIEQESGEQDPFDRVVADNSRLKSLGWNSEVSLESGLQGMVDRLSR